jgi:hypothetical protein
VLRHAPLRDASPIVQALLTLGLPLLVALGAMRASALGVIALAIGVLVALWILAGLAFRAGTVVPVAAPAVAVAVATLGAVALRSRTADGIPALPRSLTEPTGTPS